MTNKIKYLIFRISKIASIPKSNIPTTILYGKNDFKSIADFIEIHEDRLKRKQDLKSIFTTD